MEAVGLVLLGLFVLLAVLVPLLGKDSREPGDWYAPESARQSPPARS